MDEQIKKKSGEKKIIKILIVDDHAIVRRGLAQLINHEADLEVCGDAENAGQALDVINNSDINFVILDISLEGMSGLQLCERLKQEHCRLPVLVLSMHNDLYYAKRAFQAGVNGYIVKNDAAENIITAIRRILAGKIYISEKMVAEMMLSGASEMDSIINSSQ